VPAFEPFPIHLSVEQANQWVEITGHSGVICMLDILGADWSHRKRIAFRLSSPLSWSGCDGSSMTR
jgi:hypothetical protein